MPDIKLDKAVKQDVISQLQDYLADELNLEVGEFEAEFLLDFVAKLVGHHWYNQGLEDSRSLFTDKLSDSLEAATYAIDDLMQEGK